MSNSLGRQQQKAPIESKNCSVSKQNSRQNRYPKSNEWFLQMLVVYRPKQLAAFSDGFFCPLGECYWYLSLI